MAVHPASYKEIYTTIKNLRDVSYEHWLTYELFTFDWWFLLSLSIVPWIIWWRLLDRARMNEIIMFGLFVAVISTVFDFIGENAALWWGYNVKLFPVITLIFPFDLTVLPVSYMIVYQYLPKWRAFTIGMVVLAFGAAFIFEPLLAYMDIYVLHAWKYIYSVPIYFVIGIFFKWIVQNICEKVLRDDSLQP